MLPGPGYWPEGNFGVVALTAEPGTHGLVSCVDGADEFTSDDVACEGKQLQWGTGFVWDQPPSGQESSPLYRCRTSPAGERFDSLDPDCEGETADRQLGYLLTQL